MDWDLMAKLGRRLFNYSQEALQEILGKTPGGLPAALNLLYAYHLYAGFIRDDLSRMRRHQCYSSDHQRYFFAQFNPTRLLRSGGAGRTKAPPGESAVNGGCFLCLENLRWMQCGNELPYSWPVNGHSRLILPQPFPFAPLHFTVASMEHEPQAWGGQVERLQRRLTDMCALAKELPTYLILYNGQGAGASIADHLHYHCLEPFSTQQMMPLQRAAWLTQPVEADKPAARCVDQRLYPLVAFQVNGERDDVIGLTLTLALRWHEVAGHEATENIVVSTENDQLVCYYVPRDPTFPSAPGFKGDIGAYEVMGEFVFSDEAEGQALRDRRIGYTYLWRVLQDVRPFKARELPEMAPRWLRAT
jgi:hypothetical protein